jgi:hypothetical protein
MPLCRAVPYQPKREELARVNGHFFVVELCGKQYGAESSMARQAV